MPTGSGQNASSAPRGLTIGHAALQVAGLAATNHWLTTLVALTPGFETSAIHGQLDLFTGATPEDVAEIVLAFAVVPGIVEELVFRGLLFALLRRLSSTGIAVVASAIAFGAVHLDPHHAMIAMGLGLQLGVLRAVSGLTLAIVVHVSNNAFVIAVSHLARQTPPESATAAGWTLALLLASVVLSGIACASLRQRWRSTDDTPRSPRSALQTGPEADE